MNENNVWNKYLKGYNTVETFKNFGLKNKLKIFWTF